MSTLFSVHRSRFLFITVSSLFFTSLAVAEPQAGGAQVPNCVPQADSAMTSAVQAATVSLGPIVAKVADEKPVTVISPSSIMGGAGGYSPVEVDAGSNSALFTAGLSHAGTSKSYYVPAGIYYYAVTDRFQVGVGQNGFLGNSSAGNSSAHGAGDVALNAVVTAYQTKSGKFAVASLTNGNINLGSHAYDNGLTAHSGVSTGAIVSLTPSKGNTTYNLGEVQVFSLGAPAASGTAKYDFNAEADHQFSGRLKNFVGSLGVQTGSGNGAGNITPFAAGTYSKGSNQFLISYSEDGRVPAGSDKTKSVNFGIIHVFPNKKAKSE